MIISHESLADIRHRHRNDVVVYTSGCFDILHPGHISHLEYVKSLGDVAVIGITPDVRVRQRKGPNRPINPQEARAVVIDAIRHVDYTFITPETAPRGYKVVGHHVLAGLRPDIYVTHDRAWSQDEVMLAQQGTNLVLLDPLAQDKTSTSAIVGSILNRYGPQAA